MAPGTSLLPPACLPCPPSCRLDALRKGMADCVDHCRKLERDYQWIPSERAQFGRPGSDYDWEANDPEKASGHWHWVAGVWEVLVGGLLVSAGSAGALCRSGWLLVCLVGCATRPPPDATQRCQLRFSSCASPAPAVALAACRCLPNTRPLLPPSRPWPSGSTRR